MIKCLRDDDWLKQKEEFHRHAMEIKRIRDEERKRGYSMATYGEIMYKVSKDGLVSWE